MSTIADLPPSTQLRVGPGSNFNLALDAGGLKQRLTYKVKWEETNDFLAAVVGPLTLVGGVTRRIPLQNQFFPSLYAQAISGVKGFGADAAISASRPHTWNDVTIEYGQPTWDVDGSSPFISITEQGSSRSVTVPGQQYAISSGTYSGQKIQQDVAIPIGGVALQMTIHQLPDLAAFRAVAKPLLGKVNSADLTVAGATYEAGTLYFETWSSQTTKSILGSPQSEASVSLIYSALPWNKVIDPGGSPASVTPTMFQVASFAGLVM